MQNRRSLRGGFTLIEVLLVLVIIAGLATVVVVAVGGSQKEAKVNETKARMGRIGGALDRYKLSIGHYPTEEEGGLQALLKLPSFDDEDLAKKWSGPYLTKEDDLNDAWGNEFTYEVVDDDTSGVSVQRARLSSPGPDGEEGTEDDIQNWSEEEQF
ncbi:MAG: type II secretion system major pseudopilin GspG [Phycisphaerae bacterium]